MALNRDAVDDGALETPSSKSDRFDRPLLAATALALSAGVMSAAPIK